MSLGQSRILSLASVPAPLSLLVTSFDTTSEAPAIAPPGYAFLCPILEIEAEDRLSVSGEIGISIEYAPLGIPSSKLPDLQILRIADRQDFLLLTTLSSPEHAAYVPAADAGSDQYGEFGLVVTVAEPRTWSMLLAAGAMLVVARRLTRRPAYARRA